MKVKINYNNDNLYCLYWKEKIDIGERYIEVIEHYLEDEIVKTYRYDHLAVLIDEHMDLYNEEPEIFGDIE